MKSSGTLFGGGGEKKTLGSKRFGSKGSFFSCFHPKSWRRKVEKEKLKRM